MSETKPLSSIERRESLPSKRLMQSAELSIFFGQELVVMRSHSASQKWVIFFVSLFTGHFWKWSLSSPAALSHYFWTTRSGDLVGFGVGTILKKSIVALSWYQLISLMCTQELIGVRKASTNWFKISVSGPRDSMGISGAKSSKSLFRHSILLHKILVPLQSYSLWCSSNVSNRFSL
jgi:hypothetical protein